MSFGGRRGRVAALLDLAFLFAALTILAALAYPIGGHFVEKARAKDVLRKYEAVREDLAEKLGGASPESCDEVRALVEEARLHDDRLVLGVGFAQVTLGGKRGYRPVFSVCGATGTADALGVARAAQRIFSAAHRLEPGGLVRDSMVSFAAPLGPSDHVVCSVPPQRPARLCTDGERH